MNKKDFEDETKFKKYIKEIYNNDVWLIHKKKLDYFQNTDTATGDEIEEGQLYLMRDSSKMYFYYYLSTAVFGDIKEMKTGRNVGFLIYVPTVEWKKAYPSAAEIYYEAPTSVYLKTVYEKIQIQLLDDMFLNWINENPFEVKQ